MAMLLEINFRNMKVISRVDLVVMTKVGLIGAGLHPGTSSIPEVCKTFYLGTKQYPFLSINPPRDSSIVVYQNSAFVTQVIKI